MKLYRIYSNQSAYLLLTQCYTLKTAGGRAFKLMAPKIWMLWQLISENINRSQSSNQNWRPINLDISLLKNMIVMIQWYSPLNTWHLLCATRNNKQLFDLRDNYYYYWISLLSNSTFYMMHKNNKVSLLLSVNTRKEKAFGKDINCWFIGTEN